MIQVIINFLLNSKTKNYLSIFSESVNKRVSIVDVGMLPLEEVSTETEINQFNQDWFDSEIDDLDNQGSSAIQSVVLYSPPAVTMKTPEDHTVNQHYRDAADSESSNTQDDRSESVAASEAESLPAGATANKEPVTYRKKLRQHAINVKKRIAKITKLEQKKLISHK